MRYFAGQHPATHKWHVFLSDWEDERPRIVTRDGVEDQAIAQQIADTISSEVIRMLKERSVTITINAADNIEAEKVGDEVEKQLRAMMISAA